MGNVTIPFGENPSDTAVLLLAAAEEAGEPAGIITTGSFGNFYAPEEIAEAAGVDYIADDQVDQPENANVDPTLSVGEPNRYLTANAADGEDALEKTLVEDEVYDPSKHSVKDVLAYLQENPDQREAVIAAEQAGSNRVTITESE